MPHAKSGQIVHVGDKVLVEFVVKEVYPATDYCNVSLQFAEPFYPDMNRFDNITVNAKMIMEVAIPSLPIIEAYPPVESGEFNGQVQ